MNQHGVCTLEGVSHLQRTIHFVKTLILTVAVVHLPLQPSFAALDLTCPRLVHSDSWTSYSAVLDAMEEPVQPFQIMTSVYDRNGWPENRPTSANERLQEVTEFVALIEQDVAKKALAFTVEALYKVYDPREVPNSIYHTETNRIANRVAYMMCSQGCDTSIRRELAERAQVYVDELVDARIPRWSIQEIKEHLIINYQGLNSILEYRTETLGLPHFDSYRHHYLTLLTDFPGPLMRTSVMERVAGPMFTREDIEIEGNRVETPEYRTRFATYRVKNALNEFHANLRTRWTHFNHNSMLKLSVWERMSLYNILNILDGTVQNLEPTFIEERLLLLAKYMISAPVAVAQVLNENPQLHSRFCWIIEEMDRVISTNHIDTSVAGLNNYLMPMTIGLLVFAAPFSAGLWMAGLVILNIVTAIDVMGRAQANNRLQQEIDFYRRHELPGTFNLNSLDHTEQRRETHDRNQRMIRNILLMEAVFGGVAIGVSRVSRRIIQRMSQERQVQILQRPFQRENMGTYGRRDRRANRALGARVRTQDALDVVIRRNESVYREALETYTQSVGYLSRDQLIAFNITFFLKHGTRNEVLHMLLKNRYTAFGSLALNIELANEIIEQVYVHINTAPMSDYTAVTVILEGFQRAMAGNL